MNEKQELLIECAEFWEESAQHDRNQVRLSVLTSIASAAFSGLSVYLATRGYPAAYAFAGIGAAGTYAFAKEAHEENSMRNECIARASEIRSQI